MRAIALALLLCSAVFTSWVGALAFLRLQRPLERLHLVGLVNVAVLGPLMVAGLVSRGVTPQALKCVLLWLSSLAAGALLAHVTARALHVRGGEAK